jgi:hypothetical protein
MTRSAGLRLPRQHHSTSEVSLAASRTLAVIILGIVLGAQPLHGQDRSRYRDFLLGSSVASVAALANTPVSAAKSLHQRPAVIQQLDWRPRFASTGPSAPPADPVRQLVFSFYDDQLFKIVVDYDPNRIAGMTATDMIEAITSAYGSPLIPSRTRGAATQFDDDSGTVVATWGDADHRVVLYDSPYNRGFRLVVTSPRLDALARTATTRAVFLDNREAPQRDLARQKKEAEDTRLAQEKSRLANKAVFRP